MSSDTGRVAFNFDTYAQVLLSLIRENFDKNGKPMVIGIHGEWGSGKTTLLDTIASEVEISDEGGEEKLSIVPIKFNVWRFEKDKHLIVPLLKTLYYKLKRMELSGKNNGKQNHFKNIRDGLFAIISGFEIEFGFGNFAKVKYTGKESVAYADKKYMQRQSTAKSFSNKYES